MDKDFSEGAKNHPLLWSLWFSLNHRKSQWFFGYQNWQKWRRRRWDTKQPHSDTKTADTKTRRKPQRHATTTSFLSSWQQSFVAIGIFRQQARRRVVNNEPKTSSPSSCPFVTQLIQDNYFSYLATYPSAQINRNPHCGSTNVAAPSGLFLCLL